MNGSARADQRTHLRASLIWRDEVMGDVVVPRWRSVTVGSDHRNTFVVPAHGLPERYAILGRKGSRNFLLQLSPGMSGRFSVDGVEHDVTAWLRREGEGESRGGKRVMPVSGRDWGVIELDDSGEYRIFFQFVPDETPLPVVPLTPLGLLGPALAFSVVMHLVALVTLWATHTDDDPFVWPGPRALTGNYLLTRLAPEPPPPPPPPVAATPQNPATGPAAASTKGQVKNIKSATKGAEGKAGGEGKEPRARDPDAKDVPPEPPKVALFEDRNRRVLDNVIQTELATSLGKFTGLPGPRQRGGVGSGTGKGTGFGPGDGTGTTRGSKGKGPGGGGSVEGDFVSQGKIDTGETRAPKGTGGTGSGVKEVAVVGTGSATGDFGGLSRDEIDRVVKARQGLIKACYQKELNHTRGLGGKLVVNFVIAADGSVSSTRVDPGKSTLRNDSVESCVRTQIARLRFPAKGGGVVNYPFIFSQG